MATLINKTKNLTLASNVMIANSFWTRAVGLLGRSEFAAGSALWISPCNSVHTWFMRFAIDVVFIDRQQRVTAVHTALQPWRMVWHVCTAHSAFEMMAGTLEPNSVAVGDELHVAH